MIINPALFRDQLAHEGGGRGPPPPPAKSHGDAPAGASLEALRLSSGQPSMERLSNEAILDALARFKRREKALQDEVVSEAGGALPPGSRSLEDWRREWKEFGELRKSVERLYVAEAIRRGIYEDRRGFTTLLTEVSELVASAIRDRHAPILRLMKQHTPSIAHDYLESADVTARQLGLSEWKYPLTSEHMLRAFLSAAVLEEINEGEGVKYLKSQSKGRLRRIPAPVSQNGQAQEPRTFWGKLRDFLLEERF